MAHLEATFREKVATIRDMMWLAATLMVATMTLTAILYMGTTAVFGDPVKPWVQNYLGITGLADELSRVTGSHRVIRQPDGMDFVVEPVHVGEAIVLVVFVARTERGRDCRLESATAVYVDHNGVTFGGNPMPPVRQIGTEVTRLEVRLKAPEHLSPGHTIVQLQLSYSCDGESKFELTNPTHFLLLPERD